MMMSASVSPSAMVWRSTITGDASGPPALASIGTNDVNGPEASSETAHASAPIAPSVRSTSSENDSERPVMIRPIANTSATPTTAITKRFHRHCKSRSAALSTATPSLRARAPAGVDDPTLLTTLSRHERTNRGFRTAWRGASGRSGRRS